MSVAQMGMMKMGGVYSLEGTNLAYNSCLSISVSKCTNHYTEGQRTGRDWGMSHFTLKLLCQGGADHGASWVS